MTKTEAIAAMEQGERVTHECFYMHEYIYLSDGELMDEDHIVLPANEFWYNRLSAAWDTGWSIYQPETGPLAD